MLWMTFVSFRRNLQNYSLAIIGLALAVLVSCIGLSGLGMLQDFALVPLRFLFGENVIIADARTEIKTTSTMIYADPLDIKPFSATPVNAFLEEVAPGAKQEKVLIAPYRMRGGWNYVAGRNDPDENIKRYLYTADITEGVFIDSYEKIYLATDQRFKNNEGKIRSPLLYLNAGDYIDLIVPSISYEKAGYDWSIPNLVKKQVQVQSLYDSSSVMYMVDWVELDTLQQLVGGDEPVSFISIECSLNEMDELKNTLVTRIEEENLPLQVWTIYDVGELLYGDFERFEVMADYYVPVMMFVSVLIVLVNSIALTLSRRKELALMRIVGFSQIQIQMMFIAECIIIALLGGLLGTGIAGFISMQFTNSFSVSWLPFIISLISTAVVSTITTVLLTKGSLASTMRNPAE